MTDKNRDDLRLRGSNNDELDRALDTALAICAAVEPRPGLEDRVLANLQVERGRMPERPWWYWGIAAAVAAVIVMAVALAWRSDRPSPPQLVQEPSPKQQNPKQSPLQAIAKNEGSIRNAAARTPKAHIQDSRTVTATGATANPKLDVFPSPQPLSEQERLLLDYVHQSPVEAVRIARAQTELAEREELERRGTPSGADQPQNLRNVPE